MIDHLLEQLLQQPIVVFAILAQPSVEGVDSIQLERESKQAVALGGRKLAVELVEAVQQIEFAQHDIQRQARAQLAARLVKTCAQQVGKCRALLDGTVQQRGQVDNQHQAV
ncbi:hypothetical protein D3C75_1085880 [compost metagenome]